ncbi:hypothetical protein JQN72_11580 [Phycicoccus sp. CSK15P-2]|uniref:hypothetical protein n=1 Tax=Phycicoccus sp. CSK15P-2 TaxID=2807627 RepID=UPI0019507DCA|nr:hypothetical protein [Phycicoccus sp. CSK15P-2]MBM6404882.1 hypothetical protein [Phycicoccus sp. CSK15P-2]
MSSSHTPERPVTVTVVLVLTYLAGLFDVFVGGALWFLADDAEFREPTGMAHDTISAIAAVFVSLGLVTVAVGVALARGSRVARVLVTASMTLRLAAAVYGLLTIGLQAAAESLIDIVLALAVVEMLWTNRATAFFIGSRS